MYVRRGFAGEVGQRLEAESIKDYLVLDCEHADDDLLTVIPPSEWHTNPMGLSGVPSIYMAH